MSVREHESSYDTERAGTRPGVLQRNLDRIVRLAARQFNAPIALVSLTDKCRQTLMAQWGSDASETDRHLAFCAALRGENDILVAPDTLEDARFRDGPLVKGRPTIRFYAGAPLKAPDGRKIGALCLLDTKPRKPLTEPESALLADLAEIASGLAEMSSLPSADTGDPERERRLTIAEQQLCLFMEYAPVSVAMFNRDMEYLAASRRWRDTFRLGDKDIFGRSHYELAPETIPRWKADYERCLSGEALRWEEDYLERSDGAVDWFRREMHPWFDADGAVGGIIAFNEIITDWKRAADELERSERFLNAVLESVQDGIVACDENGKLTIFNPAAEQMILKGPMNVSLERWSEVYNIYEVNGKEPFPAERLPLVRALRGEIVESEEVLLMPPQQSPRQIICKAQPMRGRDGARLGAVASMQDVTERREIEARYLQAQKLEAIGQLTGGLAHDFNNLLAVILGNLQLIQRAPGDEEKLIRRVSSAISAAQRGAELTTRLLAIARRQSLAAKAMNVNTLISGLEDLLTRALGENISVKTALQDGLWTTCIDESQLEAAILNLAINSRDAMKEGGILTIRTGNVTLGEEQASRLELAPGDFVLLSISDTGAGMPEEVRSRALEPFFTTKEVGRGSGLGLSIVYGFMHQSGGQLEIESEEGRGTTVSLYFPRSKATLRASDREHEPCEPPETASRSEHILVVEDDPAVRDVAVALLEDLGYRTAQAPDGESALEMLRRSGFEFDLLLTDVVMPGQLNGPVLARLARREFPHLRILFMSGYADAAMLRSGEFPPDIELVSKPLRRDNLMKKVRTVLQRSARRQVQIAGTLSVC